MDDKLFFLSTPVFTKTKVVPGVGSNVLVKLIIKPFGIAHETKVLCSNEWSAKGIMHSVVHVLNDTSISRERMNCCEALQMGKLGFQLCENTLGTVHTSLPFTHL